MKHEENGLVFEDAEELAAQLQVVCLPACQGLQGVRLALGQAPGLLEPVLGLGKGSRREQRPQRLGLSGPGGIQAHSTCCWVCGAYATQMMVHRWTVI